MLTAKEKEYAEAVREFSDKYILVRLQRTYLKYNPKDEKNCLCTPNKRKLWKEMFYNWFDNVK